MWIKKTLIILGVIPIIFFSPLGISSIEAEDCSLEITVEETAIDNIVYCDYYPWFNEAIWRRGYSNTPYLGFYNSQDKKVIQQHVAWGNEFGIDVWRIEYELPLDEQIQNGILNTDLGNTRVCMMYDIMIRNISAGKGEPPYNFDDPYIYNNFINDINHIANTYFSHPNYFNINGRPVLWIYITRELYGNWKQAVYQARQEMNNMGYNVYLIGDHIYYDYDYDGIELFDAVGIYSPYQAGPPQSDKLIKRMDELYLKWSYAAKARGVDLIPGGMPGYNDTCLAHERICMRPFSCSPSEFNWMLHILLKYADPVNGAENIRQFSIATFNENQEGSGVEPSQEWGYSRIEQIPKVFGEN